MAECEQGLASDSGRAYAGGRPAGASRIAAAGRFAFEAFAETLWPTHCALCNRPGRVLCDRCLAGLPYLDWWRACRRCGSPYGFVQCDACGTVGLARMGRDALPFEACASVVEFTERTGRVVRVFKDQGEQRLADVIAHLMEQVLPPSWPFDAVTFVPATLSAYRYRGFDHAELMASSLARAIGTPCQGLLERPRTRDQRKLDARRRRENLEGRFRAQGGRAMPSRLLLVDDVYTTGSTLCSATDALLQAGAREVRCLTFARV